MVTYSFQLGTGSKGCVSGSLENREHQNRKKKYFGGFREQGKQGKFCKEKGDIDHPWGTLGNGASSEFYFKRKMQLT